MKVQDCRHFEATLSEWIFEGSVEEKRLAPLKGHLKTCDNCRPLKKEFEALQPHLKEETLPSPPPELKAKVLSVLKGEKEDQRKAPQIILGLLQAAAAASLFLMISLGIYELYELENQLRLKKIEAASTQENVEPPE